MKKFPIFLAILLSFSLVSALDFTPELEAKTIVKEFQNSLNLNIKITDAPTGNYNLYTLADVLIEPSEIFQITESPFEKSFKIRPTSTLDVDGYYTFSCVLNHRDVEKIEKKLTIKVVNLEDILNIETNSIDLDEAKVKILIENSADVPLRDITAKFSSALFETTETFSLEANSVTEIPIEINEETLKKLKAGSYILDAEFETPKEKTQIEGKVYIGEKSGITTQEDSAGIIIHSNLVTKINSGNVPTSVEVTLKKNIFTRLFTSFNVEPTSVGRKGLVVEYYWLKTKLGPAEVFTVKAKTNYIFPLIVLAIAAAAIWAFRRYLETRVEMKKSVTHMKTKNGEFALKVKISIRAKTDIEKATLIDQIPSIVKLYKKFPTAKPDKIDAATRRIHWDLGDMKAGERRVLDYIVYSKVGVVGKFSMPSATLIFEENEKILEAESNKVFFLSDQVTKE